MITLDEKIIILGALFHDIGKFEQRCTNRRIPHSELGSNFFDEISEEITKILDSDNNAFSKAKKIISNHHLQDSKDDFVNLIRSADHLSASERVGFNEEDNWQEKWSHKFMTSLFSKVYLNETDSDKRKTKYYAHKLLTENNYKIIIPQYYSEKDIKESSPNFPANTFENFFNDIKTVLGFYEKDEDFNTVLILMLNVIEKYMWCIPDFTGSNLTDISLYNHLKDVAGLSHAIFKSDKEGKNLNLIIGDLPGIQNYIFNVAQSKPAKILRGRSIFVQIVTRQAATIVLNNLGLTDASLIMLAGGKFYIVAQDSNNFEDKFEKAKEDIEHNLINNYNYQLSFSCVFHSFNYEDLKNKKITFGDIIDEASYKLLLKKNQQFENILFEKDDFDQNQFVLQEKYIAPDKDLDSNSIKCAVTDLPIRHIDGNPKIIQVEDGENIRVDKQVWNEFEIVSKAPKSNVVIEFNDDFSSVIDVKPKKILRSK